MQKKTALRITPAWHRLQIKARRQFNRLPLSESQKIYILTLLIGAFCGLAAVSFHLLLDYFQHHLIYAAAALQSNWRWPLVLLLPALGGLVAGAGLYFFAPEARGSGIPQVKWVYGARVGRLRSRDGAAKFFLAALQIGTGSSLGREGPTVQICATVASSLGRLFALSPSNQRRLIPVGAAAGIAEIPTTGRRTSPTARSTTASSTT